MRFTILLIALVNSLTLFAATPVGWRMDGSGVFATAKPQTHWGTTDHVVWATPLPQWSNASPVLVSDRIFVCAEPSTLLCLDLTGKILWQHSLDYSDLPAPPAAEVAKNRAAIADQHLQAGIAGKKAELVQLKAAAAADKDDPGAKAKADALAKEIAASEKQMAEIDAKIQALLPLSERKLPVTNIEANGYTTGTPVSDGWFVCVM